MRGRDFLDLAHHLVVGSTEVYWRAAAIHAYYALMLECRDVLSGWGHPVPPHQNVHAVVRLRFRYASDRDLNRISDALDWLVQLRNRAPYDLKHPKAFASSAEAQQANQKTSAALILLDSIDSDPARRAAASATLRP